MTTQEVNIFIELSSDLQDFFDVNSLDIGDCLREQGVSCVTSYQVLPDHDKKNPEKSLALVILAGAGGILAVGQAVSQILQTIYRRPHLVESYEYVTVLDSNGNALRDEDGAFIVKKIKNHKLLEAVKQNEKSNFDISMTETKGILLKFSSESQQIEKTESKK